MDNMQQYPDAPRSLTRIIDSSPQWSNYAPVFGNETIFKVENWGLIKSMFLKFTVVPPSAIDFALPTSPYIIENVFLESNGIAFARVNTTYTLSRIDSLSGSGLYNRIIAASSISGTFDSVQTISMPLFFFAIDGQVFDPSTINNLTVRVTTKSSAAAMGFSGDPTSISVKLTTIYDQGSSASRLSCPPLKNFYGITQDQYAVSAVSSQSIVSLANPSKVKSLIFMIRRNANGSTIAPISSVKLRFSDGSESSFDNLTNYNINGPQDGTNDGSTFKVSLDYLKMNRNMNPVQATVNYSALYESTLFVVYEYISELLIENGNVLETFTQRII